MFPLKEKIISGYRFGQKTFYSNSHTGTDYKANYVEYYAPFDGFVKSGSGIQGGLWAELTRSNGDLITARHLSKIIKTGQVKEGDLIAITGNTGALTTGKGHLHLEVKKNGQLIDPETYQWGIAYPIQKRVTILMNQKPWNTLLKHMAAFQDWVWKNSSQKLQLIIDYKETAYKDFPLVYTGPVIGGENMAIIEPKYFKSLLDKADFTFLVIPTKDWKGGVFNSDAVELGYCYTAYDINGAFIVADEWTDCFPYFKPPFEGLAKIMTHEFDHWLMHKALKNELGQGFDFTHNCWFSKPSKPQNTWDYYDITKLI